MAKMITGEITCTISFYDLCLDEGETVLDAVLPDGWEGEMQGYKVDIVEAEDIEED